MDIYNSRFFNKGLWEQLLLGSGGEKFWAPRSPDEDEMRVMMGWKVKDMIVGSRRGRVFQGENWG